VSYVHAYLRYTAQNRLCQEDRLSSPPLKERGLPGEVIILQGRGHDSKRDDFLALFQKFAPEAYFSAFCAAEMKGMNL